MLKKTLFILTIFTILLLAFSAVSAADSDDVTVSEDNNLLSADDTGAESEKIEVELTANEQYGIYGNKDTKLTVQVLDNEGNNVTAGSVTFVDVFGENYTASVKNGSAQSNVYVGETGKFNITCLY
ncbi:hypothetical protein J5751_00390, partial [bacterium]|nr:hypothetical protein [bacterium]